MIILRKAVLSGVRMGLGRRLSAAVQFASLNPSVYTSRCCIHHLNIVYPSSQAVSRMVPYPSQHSVSYSTATADGADKGSLVYEGRVKSMMRNVKIFSLTTSFFGLLCQPYLWYTLQDLSLVFAAPLFTVVNFFVFINPILIHYLAKRYVTELHYNSRTQTYTVSVFTLFARRTSFSFTANDVVVPEIPGLFSTMLAKDRPLFVDDRDFPNIEVYKHMMGFDKPLDLTYSAEGSEKKG